MKIQNIVPSEKAKAYFARIGFKFDPTLSENEFLNALQYAHVTSVPYENLDILNKDNAQNYIDLTIKVLTNDSERLKLANECIRGCKDYNWDRATKEIIDMLESPQPTEKDLYNYVISQINKK